MVTIPRIIVGISGASGMRTARTLLDVLLSETTVAIDLIVSEAARQVWTHELGSVPLPTDTRIMHFDNNDLAAAPASGSRRTLGMVIAPCSMATAARIAHGIDDNLMARAASVTLKERRALLLSPRETPLSSIHLGNLLTLSQAGAIIMPPLLPSYIPNTSPHEQEIEFARHILEFFNIGNRKHMWQQDSPQKTAAADACAPTATDY